MPDLRRPDPGVIPILIMLAILVLMNIVVVLPRAPVPAVIGVILGGLYVVGIPVIGLLTVAASIFRVFLRELTWRTAGIQILAIALLGLFWAWTIDPSAPWGKTK